MQAHEGGDGKISLRVMNMSIIGREGLIVAYDSSFPSRTIRIDTQSSVISQSRTLLLISLSFVYFSNSFELVSLYPYFISYVYISLLSFRASFVSVVGFDLLFLSSALRINCSSNLKIMSSRIWRRVVRYEITSDSREPDASVCRVQDSSTLKMQAAISSENSVIFNQTIWCHMLEHSNIHVHRWRSTNLTVSIHFFSNVPFSSYEFLVSFL